MSNPYTLTFGKTPTEYINRYECMNEIVTAFTENPAKCQTYLIRGVRGSGKTVLMTAIAKEIVKDEEWICVDLNSTQNLLDDLSYRLEDACENLGHIFDRGIDVSLGGFGIGIGGRDNRDSVSRCEKILSTLAKKRKKVLITVDEVSNDASMKQLASQFQIWIRKDFPIFLLMTGLYENIHAIQNNPQLTFLLRSPKVTLGPLGIAQITRQYESSLAISRDKALELAKMTKGYAFAFQALGMLCWENKNNSDISNVIRELDNLLDEYVYQKIWAGLSQQDRMILISMPDEGAVRTKDVYEKIGMTLQSFSKYRERLINKGLIQTAGHGYIELTLPRFVSICSMYEGF